MTVMEISIVVFNLFTVSPCLTMWDSSKLIYSHQSYAVLVEICSFSLIWPLAYTKS